jgi:hypothetical protein
MLNRICFTAMVLMGGATALAQTAAPAASTAAPAATDERPIPPFTRHEKYAPDVRFREVDSNHNGKIELQEFLFRPGDYGEPSPKWLPDDVKAHRTKRFKMGDKNGDGFLTVDEFTVLLTIPHPNAPKLPNAAYDPKETRVP